jgi:5-methylcytosine-specific restriction enzyme subunit McrC
MEWTTLDAESSEDALNLLAKILTVATDRLIKRGLDRGYLAKTEKMFGVRGRIDIATTIKTNGLSNLSLTCNFEELDYSIIHNQIIKSILEILTKTTGLDKSLKEDVHDLLHRMQLIKSISLSPNVFASVRFHSNIRNYRLPIAVSQLIYEQLLPSTNSGEYSFVNLSDEKLFRIFEKFLFNFYKKHLDKTSYTSIKKEGLLWQDSIFEDGLDDLLPAMETDICLFNESNRLIIECKFYESALQARRILGEDTTGKFISGHIFQLYAYLKNLELKHLMQTSGMIIYPENGKKINSTYTLQGHKVLIKTIDLNMSPSEIQSDLMSCLNFVAGVEQLKITTVA